MRCSISECREKAVGTVRVGPRETRNLCSRHLRIYRGRDKSHEVGFARASDMDDGSGS